MTSYVYNVCELFWNLGAAYLFKVLGFLYVLPKDYVMNLLGKTT
jgi:hypothetical protein